MGDGKSFQLLGDVPLGDQVGSENAFAEDKLSLQASATVLARATVETPETITIGIYGPWGTGKTSFMQMMKSVVEENNEAVGVWFNAWQFEREEHLIVPLVATIAKRLDQALDKRDWSGHSQGWRSQTAQRVARHCLRILRQRQGRHSPGV
jgi:ATPase subunit of ABC transporter with duplicated ATPase domains